MADLAIDVVYEDNALLVLNKPSGLLSVPGKGDDKQDCASARVQAHYPDALVVHRLDMATSGLMLMARGAAAQRDLSKAFASRNVHKRYVAVVAGTLALPNSLLNFPLQSSVQPSLQPSPDGWAVIDLPIALDWPNRPRRIIDSARGKPSVTRWRVVPDTAPTFQANLTAQVTHAERDAQVAQAAQAVDATLATPALNDPLPPSNTPQFDRSTSFTRLELSPVTGRSHQLRVHLAALGHPILGDALYATPNVQARASRLLLHATGLTLAHPVTGQPLQFDSPAPF